MTPPSLPRPPPTIIRPPRPAPLAQNTDADKKLPNEQKRATGIDVIEAADSVQVRRVAQAQTQVKRGYSWPSHLLFWLLSWITPMPSSQFLFLMNGIILAPCYRPWIQKHQGYPQIGLCPSRSVQTYLGTRSCYRHR